MPSIAYGITHAQKSSVQGGRDFLRSVCNHLTLDIQKNVSACIWRISYIAAIPLLDKGNNGYIKTLRCTYEGLLKTCNKLGINL